MVMTSRPLGMVSQVEEHKIRSVESHGCDYKGRASRAVREGQAKDPGHRIFKGVLREGLQKGPSKREIVNIRCHQEVKLE